MKTSIAVMPTAIGNAYQAPRLLTETEIEAIGGGGALEAFYVFAGLFATTVGEIGEAASAGEYSFFVKLIDDGIDRVFAE